MTTSLKPTPRLADLQAIHKNPVIRTVRNASLASGAQCLEVQGQRLTRARFYLVSLHAPRQIFSLPTLREADRLGWCRLRVPSMPAGEYQLLTERHGQLAWFSQTLKVGDEPEAEMNSVDSAASARSANWQSKSIDPPRMTN